MTSNEREGGVAVIIENQKGEYLLHLRDGNTTNMTNQWCLVGGGYEGGEGNIECAMREVREETGLVLQEPIFVKEFQSQGTIGSLVYGKLNTEVQDVVLAEGAALQWFGRDEVIPFIQSLGYSNPFLEEMVSFINRL